MNTGLVTLHTTFPIQLKQREFCQGVCPLRLSAVGRRAFELLLHYIDQPSKKQQKEVKQDRSTYVMIKKFNNHKLKETRHFGCESIGLLLKLTKDTILYQHILADGKKKKEKKEGDISA